MNIEYNNIENDRKDWNLIHYNLNYISCYGVLVKQNWCKKWKFIRFSRFMRLISNCGEVYEQSIDIRATSGVVTIGWGGGLYRFIQSWIGSQRALSACLCVSLFPYWTAAAFTTKLSAYSLFSLFFVSKKI